MANGFAKTNDVLALGSAEVHQHQRLLIVDTGRTQLASFPATLVDHPAGRNLHPLSIHFVMRHIGILRSQLLVFGSRHNGIHEETTAITQLGRIGQFSSPDVDDGIANMLRRQRFCSNLLLREKILAQVTIIEMGHKSA